MIKRVVLGVVVGTIVVFLVSSLWHMASGLGQIGIQNLPDEDAVLSAMRGSIHSSGLYFFPGMDAGAEGSKQQPSQAAYLRKYKAGPTGILIYHPGGAELAFGKLLAVQFLTGMLGALLLGLVLAMTVGATTFSKRTVLVVAISLFCRGHLRDTVLELVRFPCKLHPCPRRRVDRELERRGHGHGRDDQAGPGNVKLRRAPCACAALHWGCCGFGPKSP